MTVVAAMAANMLHGVHMFCIIAVNRRYGIHTRYTVGKEAGKNEKYGQLKTAYSIQYYYQ